MITEIVPLNDKISIFCIWANTKIMIMATAIITFGVCGISDCEIDVYSPLTINDFASTLTTNSGTKIRLMRPDAVVTVQNLDTDVPIRCDLAYG